MESQGQERQSQKRYVAVIILLLLITCVSIGYAVLSTSLNISGTSTIKNSTWGIELDDENDDTIECPDTQKCTINPTNPDDLTPDDGIVTPENPNPKGAIIWMDGNTVYFKHLLSKPGDVFTFTATYTNTGSIDAKVTNVTKSELNATAQQFMTYTVTYEDGTAVQSGDRLNAGQTATFKVTVTYKPEITVLPTDAQLALINETSAGHTGATSLFTVNYEQA